MSEIDSEARSGQSGSKTYVPFVSQLLVKAVSTSTEYSYSPYSTRSHERASKM